MNYAVLKTKKMIRKLKNETPQKNWIDEFKCIREKMYAFRCGNHNKNEIKVFANLNRKIKTLRNTKLVYVEVVINKNVIIMYFV